jgi:NADPH-dependent ferric siderophore reductase
MAKVLRSTTPSIEAFYSVQRYGPASVPRMKTALQAVKEGIIHVLEEMRETFSPKDLQCLAVMAAGQGQITVLEWIHRYHQRRFFTHDLCATAMRHHQLPALEWLVWHTTESVNQHALLQEARGYSGYEDIVRWLESNTPRPTIIMSD